MQISIRKIVIAVIAVWLVGATTLRAQIYNPVYCPQEFKCGHADGRTCRTTGEYPHNGKPFYLPFKTFIGHNLSPDVRVYELDASFYHGVASCRYIMDGDVNRYFRLYDTTQNLIPVTPLPAHWYNGHCDNSWGPWGCPFKVATK